MKSECPTSIGQDPSWRFAAAAAACNMTFALFLRKQRHLLSFLLAWIVMEDPNKDKTVLSSTEMYAFSSVSNDF
jgi:hypothetical protein